MMDSHPERAAQTRKESGHRMEGTMRFNPGHSSEFVQKVFGVPLAGIEGMDEAEKQQLEQYFTFVSRDEELGYDSPSIIMSSRQAKKLIEDHADKWPVLFFYLDQQMSSLSDLGDIVEQYLEIKAAAESEQKGSSRHATAIELLTEMEEDLTKLIGRVNTINEGIVFLAQFVDKIKAHKDGALYNSLMVGLSSVDASLKKLSQGLESIGKDPEAVNVVLLNLHSFMTVLAA